MGKESCEEEKNEREGQRKEVKGTTTKVNGKKKERDK